MRLGIDIGSTTIKCALLNDDNEVIYHTYERHYCLVSEKLKALLRDIQERFAVNEIKIAVSGSAAMGYSEKLGLDFYQEVYATRVAANTYLDNPDCIIELGGEDAKILFLTDGMEIRMNGTCAGGTGAFIDQMAQLLNVDVKDMNTLAKKATKRYTIASRCGVFAKSDIQPLINEGAKKEDLALSIYYAVCNQTIGGLAQGREIKGKVVYLGGPLTFNSELRKAFDNTLKLKGIFPEYSLNYVAMGAALLSSKECNIDELITKIQNSNNISTYNSLKPLFNNEDEYIEFKKRHNRETVKISNENNLKDVYLGVDAGSTTLKFVLINQNEDIVYSSYQSNKGNTLELLRNELINLYKNNPDIHIISSCVTGYGENMIRQAFRLDYGIVETMAHLKAALRFKEDVDFIIDIGGQDIKCFKIQNGSLDNLFLNEACSSGCGSFLETFAKALGYDVEEFAKLALFAKHPVDLGSRCTVFMNSSIKEAQKNGASVEDISAGLSISVIKNALYKVIRTTDKSSLGKHIIAQGGTFYNDAVLRAFEMELGMEVTRPNIAGLMGSYGAALYAKENARDTQIITLDELINFKNNIRYVNCGLCENHCKLSINTFNSNDRYISGNRCERPVNNHKEFTNLNIYEFKREYLDSFKPSLNHKRQIGLPMALNMYEMYPFWFTFFDSLGFEVIKSDAPSTKSFSESLNTIPSDTVCFPAKLVHSAINSLLNKDVDYIFYPCMTYNIREKDTKNSYNCPVVAYYPEVIAANMPLGNTIMIYPHISILNKGQFRKHIYQALKPYFKDIHHRDIKKAADKAYLAYEEYRKAIREKGRELIAKAEIEDKEIIVLSGRPYHIDPLINHGIDKLINSYGACVISEDALSSDYDRSKLKVLNQWSYHSRLYAAAHAITSEEHMNMVQLVSFGCGVDAITTDEVREILEGHDKIYTQLKIDEISNLGAHKIRLRSLLSAIEEGRNKHE